MFVGALSNEPTPISIAGYLRYINGASSLSIAVTSSVLANLKVYRVVNRIQIAYKVRIVFMQL